METQIAPRVLKLPQDAAEKQVDVVMCADLFPTGWHATESAGGGPGDASHVRLRTRRPDGAHLAMIMGPAA